MRLLAFSAGLLLMFSMTAVAQEGPPIEIFGGYSYVHSHPGTGLASTHFDGGSASVSLNFSPGFGIVGDFGGYHLGKIGNTTVNGTMYTYLFGPKLMYRSERIEPFVQALFGGAHANAAIYGVSRNSFALTLGGGIDLKANRSIAVRLIQFEYLMTRFKISGVSQTQNDARISAGIVLRFGR